MNMMQENYMQMRLTPVINVFNEHLIMKKEKKCITLSIRQEKSCVYLTNGMGQEWQLPKNISNSAALSMLVYTTLLNQNEKVSSYRSNYKITMEVEELRG